MTRTQVAAELRDEIKNWINKRSIWIALICILIGNVLFGVCMFNESLSGFLRVFSVFGYAYTAFVILYVYIGDDEI